tara:strand:- start:4840 stop:5004 length:165 start_codon:yes stop_codon:yes gene_type:complete
MQKNLDAGVHMIFACGLSYDGLFCDGSHQHISFKSKRLLLEDPLSFSTFMCNHL